MKKTSLLLAVFLSVGMLAGCNSQPAPTEPSAPVVTAAPTTQPTTAPTTAPTLPPEPSVIDFKVELPTGFDQTVFQDDLHVFSSPKSPKDPSKVTVEILPRDEAVLKLDAKQMMEHIISSAVAETQPTTSDPSETTVPTETTAPTDGKKLPEPLVKELEPTKIDGFDGIFVDYVESQEKYTTHIYRYEVVTPKANYAFSFCDSTDKNDWLEQFKKSAETIDLILDTEGLSLDYSHLTKYTMHSGLNISAEADLQNHEAPGFTDALANRNVLILTMADDKAANNLTQMTLEDYADLVARSNQLQPFQKDMYGNLSTSFFSSDETGLEYYNTIFVKESDEDFWVIQMTCLVNDQVRYAREFSLWASSVN